jgi:hypothetical protein
MQLIRSVYQGRALARGVVFGVALAVASFMWCQAGDEAAGCGACCAKSKGASTKQISKAKASKTKKVSVTGSRIGRDSGKTDSDLTVGVIDGKQLSNAGEGKLSEALRKNPMVR